MNRIGVDLGGTKIEVAVLDPAGQIAFRRRLPTPRDYPGIIATITGLVQAAEQETGVHATVGVGIPGTISPVTGLVKNANSQMLIGHALDKDLEAALERPVRVENDANCFALSEAADGAGAGAHCVFGVILGTGCGGGVIIGGKVLSGRNRIAGEWGHMPLPWPEEPGEWPEPPCWCGQRGCLELYLAGPGLGKDAGRPAPTLISDPDPAGDAALERHASRLARGLAIIINIIDPDVIVLGGGLSNMAHLYTRVPELMAPRVFSDVAATPIVQAKHGDSSGVRGAAWLWP